MEHAHPDDRKFFLEYIEKPVMREWSRYSYYDRWRISLGEAIFNSASFDLENRNIVLAGVNVDIDVQNGRKKLCASLKKVQKVPIG